MFAAFKERRPWAAALITLLFDPVIGMLYLNRWRLSLVYFVLECVGGLGIAYFLGPAAFKTNLALAGIFAVVVRGGGSVHAYFVAKRREPHEILSWYARWYSVAAIFVVLESLPWAVQSLPYRSFSISSGSMEPSLMRGDYIFVSRTAYDKEAPRRGEAVVFYVPHERDTVYTKRIVGLPGDRIQMRGGFLYVNGAPAKLQTLHDVKGDCTTEGCVTFHRYIETLPGGPPHRIERIDMLNYLDDTGVFVVTADSYFVLGDNRSNSLDSRMNDFGYVPRNAIIGRVAIRYFDGTTNRWTWETIN